MNALDDLIAAVEARDWRDMTTAYIALGVNASLARSSYNGDLNAAKALHDALLPGWDYHIWNLGSDEAGVDVASQEKGPMQDSVISVNPARAWLIAILRALKAGAAP